MMGMMEKRPLPRTIAKTIGIRAFLNAPLVDLADLNLCGREDPIM